MSFFDDLSNFGSGMLDSVGEGFDNLVDGKTKKPDNSANAGTTQQPTTPVKDNNGNAVTGNYIPRTDDKTLLYVGGGIGAVVLLLVVVLAVKS
ncbi:hypothetical protein L4D13_22345 [Photobacterium profundum]|uniref:hypothetical protein n=1 Tax=Photobacterium profundum TaxID=74109 RepID=UPI003D0E5D22